MANEPKPRPPIPPFTAEDWVPRYNDELGGCHSMLLGYMFAINIVNPVLTKMIETATDFDDLKTQLLAFVKQQDDLHKDVDKKWDGKDPEKYGLPPSIF